MQTNNSNKNPLKRPSSQFTLKLLFIGMLALVLLIPRYFISRLIDERVSLQESVLQETSDSWAGDQCIAGPFIKYTICKTEAIEEVVNKKSKTTIRKSYTDYFLAPQVLRYDANILPNEKSRGIYKITTYNADIKAEGHFDLTEIKKKLNTDEQILTDIKFVFALSDIKGVGSNFSLKLADSIVPIEVGLSDLKINLSNHSNADGIYGELALNKLTDIIPFEMQLPLRGTQTLSFIPSGKTTTTHAQSSWKDPKFYGSFITSSNRVDDNGFDAQWEVSFLNRDLPHYWNSTNFYDAKDKAYGVDLITQADHYQKNTRSSKYMFLVIILIFTIFFLFELLSSSNVHIFYYLLVGFCIAIFYVLLLSFSEHVGYNYAYLIAATAVSILLTFFSKSVLNSGKKAALLLSLITSIFIFIFVIIQLTQYSLLVGSIGLFIVLAAVMLLTRNATVFKAQEIE